MASTNSAKGWADRMNQHLIDFIYKDCHYSQPQSWRTYEQLPISFLKKDDFSWSLLSADDEDTLLSKILILLGLESDHGPHSHASLTSTIWWTTRAMCRLKFLQERRREAISLLWGIPAKLEKCRQPRYQKDFGVFVWSRDGISLTEARVLGDLWASPPETRQMLRDLISPTFLQLGHLDVIFIWSGINFHPDILKTAEIWP